MEEITTASQRIYEGKILSLRIDTVDLPDGGSSSREIIEHSSSIVVVPIDKQGRVLMVKQYRKAPERFLLEVPAGGLEPDELPEDGALRELQEEIGFTAGHLQNITGFWIAPGFCTEYMYSYIATGLIESVLPADIDENIEVIPVPLENIPDLIRSEDIQDGKSIAALLMAIYVFSFE